MRDFTLNTYIALVNKLKSAGFQFVTLEMYLTSPNLPDKFVIMRHDIDLHPKNALSIAELENKLGIKASYYFRIVKKTFKTDIIKKIANMEHEIGYHYEDLVLAKGDIKKAVDSFVKNLNKFKKVAPVKTICMHGNPFSKWDNRELWGKYSYRDFGIIGEPYFDIDFNKVFYLTDTGRRQRILYVQCKPILSRIE